MSPRTATRTAARRPRTPLVDIDRAKHEFFYNWSVARTAGAARDKARDTLKAWIGAGAGGLVTENETGSQIVEFAEPMLIDGHKFLGLENRKTVTSSIDPDAVDALIDSLPVKVKAEVQRRVLKEVIDVVIDDEELFKLNQEGVLSDEQLDSVFAESVKWSLNVVKD